MIVTTTDLPREKVIQRYFERDRIEKAFRVLKHRVSIRPVRHWFIRRMGAYIFICYLPYAHLSWMEMLLKEKGLDMNTRKALQKLESIYRVTFTDTHTGMSTMHTGPFTKEQKKLYKALDLLS
jgi:transposase